jgi:signal transduction histidine kinase
MAELSNLLGRTCSRSLQTHYSPAQALIWSERNRSTMLSVRDMRGIATSLRQRSLRDDRVRPLAKPAEKRPRGLGQLFRDLKVRPKLMVLHNVFFVVLTVTIYFALGHEIPARAQTSLIVILGAIYILAVLLLETTIMPLYVYRPLQLMLDADKATQDDDREHELIDGREIPGDEIGQIMRSRNQTILQLRKHEEDLQDALRRLEAQDRLVHLGLISTSVAHELNTPLSVLQGSIEKLTETTKDPAALERLARILRVTQRIKKISESLVDFSRTRTQQMELVSVQPLITESWGLVAIDEKAAQVHFTNTVDPSAVVTGNPDRLVQVFVNLLRNALYAVQANGHIQVRSKSFSRNAQRWVAVAVEDDGPGIPPDVLPNIFEAFVSSRLDARGTGLGLTVAEGIVDQHGGTITASNRAGGGACLEVALPANASVAPKEKTA